MKIFYCLFCQFRNFYFFFSYLLFLEFFKGVIVEDGRNLKLQGYENGYYIGGGTGTADALKLKNEQKKS